MTETLSGTYRPKGNSYLETSCRCLVLLVGASRATACTDARGSGDISPYASGAGAAYSPSTSGNTPAQSTTSNSHTGGGTASTGDTGHAQGIGGCEDSGQETAGHRAVEQHGTPETELDHSPDGGSDTDGAESGALERPDSNLDIPDGASDDRAPVTGGLCGNKEPRRGKTERSLSAAGLDRTYTVYEPQDLDASQPVPLVFVHHGFTMSGQAMYDLTQYADMANREKFVVAFPDGEPLSLGPWNVGNDVCGAGDLVGATGDDFAFLDAMMADIEAGQCIDRRHVFVTGFSMGGYFSHHVGCMRSDVAAVAPHSGATHAFDGCSSGPKPVIIFHGTADPLITQSCDDTARAQWVTHNGCSTDVENKAVKGGHCEWSLGCPSRGQVVYCLFDDMGHDWAGGVSGQPYSASEYESAVELTWSFFKNYAF